MYGYPSIGDLAIYDSVFAGMAMLGLNVDAWPRVKACANAVAERPEISKFKAAGWKKAREKKNQVAVLTGTNGGLGLQVVVKLAKSGSFRKVYAGMRGYAGKPEKASDLRKAVADAGVTEFVEV